MLLTNEVSLDMIPVNNSSSQFWLIAKGRYDGLSHVRDGCHHRCLWRPISTPLSHHAGLPPL